MRGLFGIVVTSTLVAACGGSSGAADATGSGGPSGGTGGAAGDSGPGGAAASAGDGSAATGGSGGTAGASTGGGGGRGGSGGNAGEGGKGGKSAAGSAGEGGAGGGVLDPELPVPSYDCRTDTTNGACVSVSGTLLGVEIDRRCARLGGSMIVNMTPESWPLACVEEELGPTAGYWYGVAVPPQTEGSFWYDLVPGGEYAGAGISLAHDDTGGSSIADHFEGGAIEGQTTYDSVIDAYTVTGTFRGRWGMPAGPSCEAGSPGTCGEADVHGTFKLLHF